MENKVPNTSYSERQQKPFNKNNRDNAPNNNNYKKKGGKKKPKQLVPMNSIQWMTSNKFSAELSVQTEDVKEQIVNEIMKMFKRQHSGELTKSVGEYNIYDETKPTPIISYLQENYDEYKTWLKKNDVLIRAYCGLRRLSPSERYEFCREYYRTWVKCYENDNQTVRVMCKPRVGDWEGEDISRLQYLNSVLFKLDYKRIKREMVL